MKFCTTCGAAVEDGTKFCPSCGAAQIEAPAQNHAEPAAPAAPAADTFVELGPETQAPKKPAKAPKQKKARKSPVGAIIAIVVVVAILGAAAALWFTGVIPGLLMKPYQRFASMHEAVAGPVVDALAASLTGDYDGIEGANTKIDSDLTVTFDIDKSGLPYYYADSVAILNDASVTMKIKAELGKESLFGFESEIMDTDVFAGTVVLGTDYVGIQVPALSDDYYVLNFSDIAELLDEMGIEADEDMIQSYIDLFGRNCALTTMSSKQVKEILTKYVDIFFSVVNEKNCVQTKGTVELNGVGKKVDCTVLTFTPTADDITAMVEELVKTASKDKDLAKLVKEIIVNSAIISGMDEDDAEDAADEAWDEALEALEDLTDAVEDIADMIEEAELKIVVGYDKNGLCLYQVAFTVDDEEGCIELDNYFDGTKGAQMLCAYSFEEEEVVATLMENSYKVNGDTVSGEMTLYMSEIDYYEPDVTIEYKVSTKDKTVLGDPVGSLTIEMEDMSVTYTAKNGKKGSEYTVSFDVDGVSGEVNISATDGSSVSKPKGKGTVIDADSYEEIFEELEEAVEEVMEDLYG